MSKQNTNIVSETASNGTVEKLTDSEFQSLQDEHDVKRGRTCLMLCVLFTLVAQYTLWVAIHAQSRIFFIISVWFFVPDILMFVSAYRLILKCIAHDDLYDACKNLDKFDAFFFNFVGFTFVGSILITFIILQLTITDDGANIYFFYPYLETTMPLWLTVIYMTRRQIASMFEMILSFKQIIFCTGLLFMLVAGILGTIAALGDVDKVTRRDLMISFYVFLATGACGVVVGYQYLVEVVADTLQTEV